MSITRLNLSSPSSPLLTTNAFIRRYRSYLFDDESEYDNLPAMKFLPDFFPRDSGDAISSTHTAAKLNQFLNRSWREFFWSDGITVKKVGIFTRCKEWLKGKLFGFWGSVDRCAEPVYRLGLKKNLYAAYLEGIYRDDTTTSINQVLLRNTLGSSSSFTKENLQAGISPTTLKNFQQELQTSYVSNGHLYPDVSLINYQFLPALPNTQYYFGWTYQHIHLFTDSFTPNLQTLKVAAGISLEAATPEDQRAINFLLNIANTVLLYPVKGSRLYTQYINKLLTMVTTHLEERTSTIAKIGGYARSWISGKPIDISKVVEHLIKIKPEVISKHPTLLADYFLAHNEITRALTCIHEHHKKNPEEAKQLLLTISPSEEHIAAFLKMRATLPVSLFESYAEYLVTKSRQEASSSSWLGRLSRLSSGSASEKTINQYMAWAIQCDDAIQRKHPLFFAHYHCRNQNFEAAASLIKTLESHNKKAAVELIKKYFEPAGKLKLIPTDSVAGKAYATSLIEEANGYFWTSSKLPLLEKAAHFSPDAEKDYPYDFFEYYVNKKQYQDAFRLWCFANANGHSLNSSTVSKLSETYNQQAEVLYTNGNSMRNTQPNQAKELYDRSLSFKIICHKLTPSKDTEHDVNIHRRLCAQIRLDKESLGEKELAEIIHNLHEAKNKSVRKDDYLAPTLLKAYKKYLNIIRPKCWVASFGEYTEASTETKKMAGIYPRKVFDTLKGCIELIKENPHLLNQSQQARLYFEAGDIAKFYGLAIDSDINAFYQKATELSPKNGVYFYALGKHRLDVETQFQAAEKLYAVEYPSGVASVVDEWYQMRWVKSSDRVYGVYGKPIHSPADGEPGQTAQEQAELSAFEGLFL